MAIVSPYHVTRALRSKRTNDPISLRAGLQWANLQWTHSDIADCVALLNRHYIQRDRLRVLVTPELFGWTLHSSEGCPWLVGIRDADHVLVALVAATPICDGALTTVRGSYTL